MQVRSEVLAHEAMVRAIEAIRVVVLDQPETLGDSDCEAVHPGFFSQPINTITSMSYAAAGSWLARRVRTVEPRHRIALGGFAGLMILNGVGSVAYHGPQFNGAQTLHDLPAFGVAIMSAAVPLIRKLRGQPSVPGLNARNGSALAVLGVLAGVSYFEGRTASSVCDPDSWMQFHGLWHLSTAAAMFTVARVLWPDAAEERVAAGDGETTDAIRAGEADQ